MEPDTWNLLFGWITGKQCLIPEGCPPPAEGLAVYAVLVLATLGIIYYRDALWRRLS